MGCRYWVLALLLAVLAAACTTGEVTPQAEVKPAQPVRIVAVGEIKTGDELWRRLAWAFRAALVHELRESEAFEGVLYPAPRALPPGAVIISGTITDVDEGSETWRFLIGNGVCAATVAGRFTVADREGRSLIILDQRVHAPGSSGMRAHIDPLYMEDVMDTLGRDTAEAVVRWARGESIEPSWW